MTALHHAVRSGSRLTVRWCMNNGAIACPIHNSYTFSHPKKANPKKSKVNLKSLVADGSSNLTQATLWECVMCFVVHFTFFHIYRSFCQVSRLATSVRPAVFAAEHEIKISGNLDGTKRKVR
jgi:hypothetical protein